MSGPLYLERSNDRRLRPDYDGDVLLWDIDKTYLDTSFSTLSGLASIPFEFAVDKRSIPGARPLLRALRRGPGPSSAIVPLYFVSGSPPQLRRVIERKMTLDGIEFDGITFKDQLALLRARRFADIKAQTAYKLKALLLYRREIPSTASWLMFGDDVESDASVFELFAEICGGLRSERLVERLVSGGVEPEQARQVRDLASTTDVSDDPVTRIFVQLVSKSDPLQFDGAKTVAARSFLQTALVLADMGKISGEAVATVANDLRRRHVCDAEIDAELDDAKSRLGVPEVLLELAKR